MKPLQSHNTYSHSAFKQQMQVIPEDEASTQPNIFEEQIRLPEGFIGTARKFDVVGYDIIKKYAIRRLKKKRPNQTKRYSVMSYTTLSSQRQ